MLCQKHYLACLVWRSRCEDTPGYTSCTQWSYCCCHLVVIPDQAVSTALFATYGKFIVQILHKLHLQYIACSKVMEAELDTHWSLTAFHNTSLFGGKLDQHVLIPPHQITAFTLLLCPLLTHEAPFVICGRRSKLLNESNVNNINRAKTFSWRPAIDPLSNVQTVPPNECLIVEVHNVDSTFDC